MEGKVLHWIVGWRSAARVLKRQRDQLEVSGRKWMFRCHDEIATAGNMCLERNKALTQRDEARDALSWLVHLHHDCGKSGGPPDDDEWKEALDGAMAILDEAGVE